MPTVGEKLRYLREQHGLSLRQLASKLEIKSYSFLSEVEVGKKKPSLDLVIKIADFFDVPLDCIARDELELEG